MMVIIDGKSIQLAPEAVERIAGKMKELSETVAKALDADPTAGVYSMYVAFPAIEQVRA